MRALNEPKVAKFEEIGAEFCVFKSNASGLKLNFCEPYVDMPTVHSENFSKVLFDFKKSISGPIELKFSGKTLYVIL